MITGTLLHQKQLVLPVCFKFGLEMNEASTITALCLSLPPICTVGSPEVLAS